jgi:hypothetical protein
MEGSSWSAVNVMDQVWLGGPLDATTHSNSPAAEHSRLLAVEYEFGCQYSNSGMFTNQVSNGIIGFSRASNTFINKLFTENKIAEHIFGLCFAYKGGELLLGAPAGELLEPIKYAALVSSSSNWYRVDVYSVHVGSAALSDSAVNALNSYSGTIVDCGTTDTYMPSSAKALLTNAFRALGHGAYQSSKTYAMTAEQMAALPAIYYELRGADGGSIVHTINPSQYMEPHSTNRYTARLYFHSMSILGASAMQDHSVVFDSERNRIGFARATCDFTYNGIGGSGGADQQAWESYLANVSANADYSNSRKPWLKCGADGCEDEGPDWNIVVGVTLALTFLCAGAVYCTAGGSKMRVRGLGASAAARSGAPRDGGRAAGAAGDLTATVPRVSSAATVPMQVPMSMVISSNNLDRVLPTKRTPGFNPGINPSIDQ